MILNRGCGLDAEQVERLGGRVIRILLDGAGLAGRPHAQGRLDDGLEHCHKTPQTRWSGKYSSSSVIESGETPSFGSMACDHFVDPLIRR